MFKQDSNDEMSKHILSFHSEWIGNVYNLKYKSLWAKNHLTFFNSDAKNEWGT